MSERPIIDAGPALNFLSIRKERLLFGVLGAVAVPETVRDEVLSKSRRDPRFAAAAVVWAKLPERLLRVISDDVTDEMSRVVERMTGLPMIDRKASAKDLGEVMVLAHAVVAAEAGESVIVLIDDGFGAKLATTEIRRLNRLRRHNATVGSVLLVNTLTILRRAATTEHLPNKSAMRDVYQRLRMLDDGLPPIETTDLLSPDRWGHQTPE